jgi:phage gp36-like protein
MVRNALVPSFAGNLPTTPTRTAADLSDTQIQDAINEADATIDSYIGAYYAVPVQVVVAGSDEDGTVGQIPHPIDYWSRNIAAYNATLTYRGSQDFADTDPVVRRYNATMQALQAVSAGKVRLQLPNNVSPNAATGAGPAFEPYAGDLFDPSDFNLHPAMYDPVTGGRPYWIDGWPS